MINAHKYVAQQSGKALFAMIKKGIWIQHGSDVIQANEFSGGNLLATKRTNILCKQDQCEFVRN